MMELGIDSFASNNADSSVIKPSSNHQALAELLERIELADTVGLDVFGVGEHHRKDFLDSAPSVILAAAAMKTKSICLTSAVSVLSAVDPVRLFQQFATLDLISNGRAQLIVGRGSFSEAFPLFGFDFKDYDALFEEKLNLLLQIRANETISWQGKFRPQLVNQSIYPRPMQALIPIWVGVGGTKESCIRAGRLGLPLMIAIIGGETHRFRPLVELYKKAGRDAGHCESQLKVGIHCIGYVAKTSDQAHKDFFPGYKEVFTKIGRERGWGPVTKDQYDRVTGPTGALIVGSVDDVVTKIRRHSKALGGISRLTLQMNVAALPHEKCCQAIQLFGQQVKPLLC